MTPHQFVSKKHPNQEHEISILSSTQFIAQYQLLSKTILLNLQNQDSSQTLILCMEFHMYAYFIF